jgi:hypothetical protein
VKVDFQGAVIFLRNNDVGRSSEALVDGGGVGSGVSCHVDPDILLRLLGIIAFEDTGPWLKENIVSIIIIENSLLNSK